MFWFSCKHTALTTSELRPLPNEMVWTPHRLTSGALSYMRLPLRTLVLVLLACCARPPTPDKPSAAGESTSQLLSVGPTQLANDTAYPLHVRGEGLRPDSQLVLGAPYSQTLPLTVIDSRHATALLPARTFDTTDAELSVDVSLEKGSGVARLSVVNNARFADLTTMTLSADESTLAVASTNEDVLYLVDLKTRKVRQVPTADGPQAMISFLGARHESLIAIAHRFEPVVLVLNTANLETRRFLAPKMVSSMAFDAANNALILAEDVFDTISALSLENSKTVWRAAVDPSPTSLALDTGLLSVGGSHTGSVQWIDASTGKLTHRSVPSAHTAIIGGATASYSKYIISGTRPRSTVYSKALKSLLVANIGPNIGPNPSKMEVSMNGGISVVTPTGGFIRHLGFGEGVTQALALDNANQVIFAADIGLGLIRVVDAKKLVASDRSAGASLLQTLSLPVSPETPTLRPRSDFQLQKRAGLSVHAGPVALAHSPARKILYVLCRFTNTVVSIDVAKAAKGTATVVGEIALPAPQTQPLRRLGQVAYFADVGKTAMSCDACHPEGHAEGMLYEKTAPLRLYRVTTLRGVRQTPPYFVPIATANLAQTARLVGDRNRFHNPKLTDTEVEALAAYSALIPTLPNPFFESTGHLPAHIELPDGHRGNPSAGMELFEQKAACISCHPPPTFTIDADPKTRGKLFDVGTPHLLPMSVQWQDAFFKGFPVPSLLGAWDIFPYFSTGAAGLTVTDDGAALNTAPFALRQAAEGYAPKHGRADLLTNSERDDLLAYLLTL
jgi:hypothetical protein